ncbi:MAG: P27 family phage terminase small subunit, partial [Oscillospiraceae bacterium]|nr:P27 family phage terminase small subunit [Oscillospiraceae bacterium]
PQKIPRSVKQMTATRWKKLIKEQTIAVGTYQPAFDSVIADLAAILQERDAAYKQFRQEGKQLMITKISDRGAKNVVQNPLITLWDKLNATALAYWRDLGLTPKGLKAIGETVTQSESGLKELSKVLSDLDRL